MDRNVIERPQCTQATAHGPGFVTGRSICIGSIMNKLWRHIQAARSLSDALDTSFFFVGMTGTCMCILYMPLLRRVANLLNNGFRRISTRDYCKEVKKRAFHTVVKLLMIVIRDAKEYCHDKLLMYSTLGVVKVHFDKHYR